MGFGFGFGFGFVSGVGVANPNANVTLTTLEHVGGCVERSCGERCMARLVRRRVREG